MNLKRSKMILRKRKKRVFRNFRIRVSRYRMDKNNKDLYYISPRDIINGKRLSRYNCVYENRVFHRNMFNGLCLGDFYGRQKIIYKRKDYRNLKRIFRARYGVKSIAV